MVVWVEAKSEINELRSPGILQATSGNATEKLKMCAITRVGESTQAIIVKQIAAEECQIEKG